MQAKQSVGASVLPASFSVVDTFKPEHLRAWAASSSGAASIASLTGKGGVELLGLAEVMARGRERARAARYAAQLAEGRAMGEGYVDGGPGPDVPVNPFLVVPGRMGGPGRFEVVASGPAIPLPLLVGDGRAVGGVVSDITGGGSGLVVGDNLSPHDASGELLSSVAFGATVPEGWQADDIARGLHGRLFRVTIKGRGVRLVSAPSAKVARDVGRVMARKLGARGVKIKRVGDGARVVKGGGHGGTEKRERRADVSVTGADTWGEWMVRAAARQARRAVQAVQLGRVRTKAGDNGGRVFVAWMGGGVTVSATAADDARGAALDAMLTAASKYGFSISERMAHPLIRAHGARVRWLSGVAWRAAFASLSKLGEGMTGRRDKGIRAVMGANISLDSLGAQAAEAARLLDAASDAQIEAWQGLGGRAWVETSSGESCDGAQVLPVRGVSGEECSTTDDKRDGLRGRARFEVLPPVGLGAQLDAAAKLLFQREGVGCFGCRFALGQLKGGASYNVGQWQAARRATVGALVGVLHGMAADAAAVHWGASAQGVADKLRALGVKGARTGAGELSALGVRVQRRAITAASLRIARLGELVRQREREGRAARADVVARAFRIAGA